MSIKIPILSVYDENGNQIPIPAIQGPQGEQGASPIKGVDYWTSADKAEIVEAATEAVNTLENVYPVGSIYLTMNATNPADLFGFGVWKQLSDSFLLGAGNLYEIGSTGGEATHTLTIAEMPSHLHDISSSLMWANQTGNVAGGSNTYYQRNESQTTQLNGGGEPRNNMPPYIAVYMWQRTA